MGESVDSSNSVTASLSGVFGVFIASVRFLKTGNNSLDQMYCGRYSKYSRVCWGWSHVPRLGLGYDKLNNMLIG